MSSTHYFDAARLNMPVRRRVTYDAATTAGIGYIETAMGSTLPNAYKTALDTFVVGVKADGDWADLFEFFLPSTNNAAGNAMGFKLGVAGTYNGTCTHATRKVTMASGAYFESPYTPVDAWASATSGGLGFRRQNVIASAAAFECGAAGTADASNTGFSTNYNGWRIYDHSGGGANRILNTGASTTTASLYLGDRLNAAMKLSKYDGGGEATLETKANASGGTQHSFKLLFGASRSGVTINTIGNSREYDQFMILANGLSDAKRTRLLARFWTLLEALKAVALLTVADVPAYTVFQHTSGTATVALSGTYTGTVGPIQARVKRASDNVAVTGWASLDAAPAGGTFSGSISVPTGGPYYAEVRDASDPNLLGTGNAGWMVGNIVVAYGQSNMSYLFIHNSSPPAASSGTAYHNGTSWEAVPARNGAREFANAYVAGSGIPVGLIDASVFGQSLAYMSSGGAGYTAMLAKIAAAGGKAAMFLWMQGEYEAVPAGLSAASYKTNFDTMHGDVAAALSLTKTTLPFLVGSLGRCTIVAEYTDASWQKIKDAQIQLGLQTGVYFSHVNTDAVLFDGEIHFDAAAQGRAGKRFAQTALVALGLSATPAHFDIVSGSKLSSTTGRMTIAHSLGTDITVGADGWEVSADQSTWAAATPTRHSATEVNLSFSSIPGTVYVRYLYGNLASGVPDGVVDNSSLELPLTYSNGNITLV
jgi:carbohydrate esterase-like sialic acid-specific acetylesterase